MKVCLEQELESLGDHLGQITQASHGLPGDDGVLSADADFRRRVAMLELDLLGIRLLLERSAGGEAAAALRGVARIRLAQARGAMAALIVATFGYYALPDPDPLLIDNEGPIGHHRALALMRTLAGYFEPDAQAWSGGEAYEQKSKIAEHILPSR